MLEMKAGREVQEGRADELVASRGAVLPTLQPGGRADPDPRAVEDSGWLAVAESAAEPPAAAEADALTLERETPPSTAAEMELDCVEVAVTQSDSEEEEQME